MIPDKNSVSPFSTPKGETMNRTQSDENGAPRLLERVRRAIRVAHLSLRTEKAYLHWIRRYILHHGKRHPQELGEAEISAFLSHLAVERQVSASTQNQALSALLFLYRTVLGRELGRFPDYARPKRRRKLPVVLTQEEVRQILSQAVGTDKLFLTLLYGTGMRLQEGLRLRVKDVDFACNQITVRDGKGKKDRVTMLPESLKTGLQEHLRRVRELHERDVAEGYGRVHLPDALAVKHPGAPLEWGWQYVFPADERSEDPRGGGKDLRDPRQLLWPVGDNYFGRSSAGLLSCGTVPLRGGG
jgi:integron integrase